jgi:hypothetical protein
MTKPRPKMVFEQPIETPKPANSHNPEIPGSTQKPAQRSRIGKRAVTFYVSQEAFRQLGILSAQTDRSIQDLMVDALNSLFQSHGLSRIAKEEGK